MQQSICITLPDTSRPEAQKTLKKREAREPRVREWRETLQGFLSDLTLRNPVAVVTRPPEQGGDYQHFITDVRRTHGPHSSLWVC